MFYRFARDISQFFLSVFFEGYWHICKHPRNPAVDNIKIRETGINVIYPANLQSTSHWKYGWSWSNFITSYVSELLASKDTQVAMLEELIKANLWPRKNYKINLSKIWKKIRLLHAVTFFRCFIFVCFLYKSWYPQGTENCTVLERITRIKELWFRYFKIACKSVGSVQFLFPISSTLSSLIFMADLTN